MNKKHQWRKNEVDKKFESLTKFNWDNYLLVVTVICIILTFYKIGSAS